MDNLTHSLVGAAIAKSGAERATPLATTTLVVAANAPDVDVLSMVNGSYFALAFRRGVTHGFPGIAVLALVITAGVIGWDRMFRLKRRPDAIPARPVAVLGLSVVGLMTHSMLDWLGVYGVRLAMPFQDLWKYRDALFIIDPWIWLVLGGALYLCTDFGTRARRMATAAAIVAGALVFLGMGLVGGAVWACGALALGVTGRNVGHLDERRQRGVAIAATGATVLYILTMITADDRARAEVVDAAEAEGWTVEDVLVSPRRGNPFAADVEVRTEAGYVPGEHRWLGSPRVVLFPTATVPLLDVPATLDSELADRIVARAHADRDAAYFLRWSRHPWTRVEESGEGWSVRIGDARYDDFPESGALAGITVELTRDDVR